MKNTLGECTAADRVAIMTQLPVPAYSQPAPVLVSVANVHASQDYVITPVGVWRLSDVNVTTVDQTTTTTHTPAWAIVMVVIFIWFFFLSLLFLLAREVRVSGYVAIYIEAGSQRYNEQVPVNSAAQRADVLNRATYLQGLIGRARYVQSTGYQG